MGEVHQLVTSEAAFGLQAAGRLMTKVFGPWVQDLALLVESVEPVRPPGALPDWQPGAVVRMPFSKKICCDGEAVCSQALMALADSAMVIACSAVLERLPADEHNRPDYAFPAAGHVRRRRRRPRRAHWPQHQLRPRYAAGRFRQAAGRYGRQRLFDVVKTSRHFAA